jgi:hypothetical protein
MISGGGSLCWSAAWRLLEEELLLPDWGDGGPDGADSARGLEASPVTPSGLPPFLAIVDEPIRVKGKRKNR